MFETDGEAEKGNAMFTVQNDWIEYEEAERAAVRLQPVPARRVAVRGGAACAQRIPVVRAQRVAAAPERAAARPGPARITATSQPARLRLTRRGRVVLVVLPALMALSGALLAAAPGVAQAAPQESPPAVVAGSVGAGALPSAR